ncbi:cation diffusion facilitator family transporter [Rugosimonospora acidiphila]|uniref:cation diffusion facilitator family transporter n=1 Tax=Rugosimonospora acidiphila TaxID=556531 RepID=UPI0031EDDCC1
MSDAHQHDRPVAGGDHRLLGGALALILAFMVGEVTVGLVAGSLALLSDAAHMLTDAAALILALVAMRLAARPPHGGYTYGLRRAEILSAQANGLALLILSVVLAVEAVRHLIAPPRVAGGLVLVTALVGVLVNLGATVLIGRANRNNLNIRGAFAHIVTDLYAFLATAAAGLVIVLTGYRRADAIATLVVAALMVRAGVGLLRASGRILLEAAPAGIDPEQVGAALAGVPGVKEVHDLHVWQIGSDSTALSAHVLVNRGGDCHDTRRALERLLRDAYGIEHTTLQVDHADGGVLQIGLRRPPH